MPGAKTNRWSKRVMETSNALDLDPGVFKKESPREIAKLLKRSAERSKRRKAEPFRSAMSMLSFYINRAGKGLPQKQKDTLEKAKEELRDLYHRPERSAGKYLQAPGRDATPGRPSRKGRVIRDGRAKSSNLTF